eukprot:m.190416 g.190416  ORF g.190416 m.190416 type:complete len:103 (-) comp18560_c0_seq1:170-478(-)
MVFENSSLPYDDAGDKIIGVMAMGLFITVAMSSSRPRMYRWKYLKPCTDPTRRISFKKVVSLALRSRIFSGFPFGVGIVQMNYEIFKLSVGFCVGILWKNLT